MSKFVHQELNTTNPAAAKKFYGKVFGWKFMDMPMEGMTYTMGMGPEGPVAGILPQMTPGAPSSWLGYIAVASVDKALAKAKKNGGKVVVPKQKATGPDGSVMGEFAICLDPTGASIGMWKDGGQQQSARRKPAKKKAKKAAKKRTAKKRTTKKTTKKRSTKKRAAKKTAKKRATKKVAKKRTTKKAAKKRSTKKAAKKRPAKKRPAKKAAKKRPAKKRPAKKKRKKK